MGNSSSTPPPSPSPSECPMKKNNSSECPMKKKNNHNNNHNSSDDINEDTKKKYVNPNQYNVYSEKIDPKNNMPARANQEMSPGQSRPLDTSRVKSTIPKGGTENDSWQYPSPQMFWNALVRKGKVDDAEEGDMDTVVAIHNNMNENTWAQLLAWEKLHPVTEEGKEPKLLHFMGRPHDLSPKARFKMLFGHPAPFDRHDWIIDRGGDEVRYVIDYYHDEAKSKTDEVPQSLTDSTSMKSIKVDVRPAIDSVDSFLDRIVRMPYEQFCDNTEYNPPSFFPTENMGTAPPFSKYKAPTEPKIVETPLPNFSTAEINILLSKIQSDCAKQKSDLSTCSSEESCGVAAVALQRCTAMVVCPTIAKEFDSLVQKLSEQKDSGDSTATQEAISKNYTAMTGCLEHFAVSCYNAKDETAEESGKK